MTANTDGNSGGLGPPEFSFSGDSCGAQAEGLRPPGVRARWKLVARRYDMEEQEKTLSLLVFFGTDNKLMAASVDCSA